MKPLMTTSIIAGGLVAVLIAGHVHIKWNTNQNQQMINNITQEIETLQGDINAAEIKQQEYKKELDKLQARLALYQDVVIPDSMK